jgi:peptide deformylase
MVLPIVVYGDPVLRKVAKQIKPDLEGLQELITNMWETMYVTDGIGLACPQIGRSLCLFVIDSGLLKKENPSIEDFKKVFINPKIIEKTGEIWTFNEGCLSIPNIREDVDRESKIRMQYFDENFTFCDEYFEGIPARIIQHEYDHLQGILFTDLVSPLKKKLLKNKLLAISRGKFDVKYTTIISKKKVTQKV